MKTGMLYDADNTRAVVQAVSAYYRTSTPPLVCDPVCVSTSGHILLDPSAIDVLINDLFPMARLITPNKAEAELLLSRRQIVSQISGLDDMLSAAHDLLQFGSRAVLLKGGHLVSSIEDVDRLSRERPNIDVVRHGLFDKNMEILQVGSADFPNQLVVDVLSERDGITLFVRPRLETTSTHGTGCTLSAAITAELARGDEREYLSRHLSSGLLSQFSVKEAVKKAIIYTYRGIETAQSVGKGHGPLNHFHAMIPRTIPRYMRGRLLYSFTNGYYSPTKYNRHPFTQFLIQGNAGDWEEYVEHEFVKQLGAGTLSQRSFIYFITFVIGFPFSQVIMISYAGKITIT